MAEHRAPANRPHPPWMPHPRAIRLATGEFCIIPTHRKTFNFVPYWQWMLRIACLLILITVPAMDAPQVRKSHVVQLVPREEFGRGIGKH